MENKIYNMLIVTGLIILALANIIGIGYGIYLWGGVGITLGAAVWTAFKLWLGIVIIGILTFFTGLTLND